METQEHLVKTEKQHVENKERLEKTEEKIDERIQKIEKRLVSQNENMKPPKFYGETVWSNYR